MELAAVAMQAVSQQQAIALQVIKQAAQSEQAIVQMIAASATMGQNLDISV